MSKYSDFLHFGNMLTLIEIFLDSKLFSSLCNPTSLFTSTKCFLSHMLSCLLCWATIVALSMRSLFTSISQWFERKTEGGTTGTIVTAVFL